MNSKFEVFVVVVLLVVICAYGTVFFSWLLSLLFRFVITSSLNVCCCRCRCAHATFVSCLVSLLFCCYCFVTTANKRSWRAHEIVLVVVYFLTEKCCHRQLTGTIHDAAANKPLIEWTYDSRFAAYLLPCFSMLANSSLPSFSIYYPMEHFEFVRL